VVSLSETNDLIYEGIATHVCQCFNHAFQHFSGNKRPDLRRDCDTPYHCIFYRVYYVKQTTWFTKGLRHRFYSLHSNYLPWWNKRPDLRRDCDSMAARPRVRRQYRPAQKQTTWFTKGLRRCCKPYKCLIYNWNKRPDLRRDCDDVFQFVIICHSFSKQTTWFTKGLRRIWMRCNLSCVLLAKQTTWFTKGLRHVASASYKRRGCVRNKRPDLRRDCDVPCLYILPLLLPKSWNKRPDLRRDCDQCLIFHFCASSMKQTTWFTKGLRPSVHHDCIPQSSSETNDLIYEGIATRHVLFQIHSTFGEGNKRPDLRRDCDSLCIYNYFCIDIFMETNDLIYEGIATMLACEDYPSLKDRKQTTWFTKGLRHWPTYHFFLEVRNKRPDLRRDCDGLNPYPSLFLKPGKKQTTWFTKGLRLLKK